MAKPITEIKSESEEDPLISLASSELLNELKEHEGALREFMDVLDTLSESGFLSLANGVLKNYRFVLNEVASELSSEKSRRFVSNALAAVALLSALDTEKIESFTYNLENTLNNADTYRKQGSIGLLTILAEMKDKDLSAGIRVILGIMRGFTSGKKEQH